MSEETGKGEGVEGPRIIGLSKGQVAFVDDKYFDEFKKMRWYATKSRRTFYARSGRKLMHHLILPIPKGKQIDHINGNGLDNRRLNLRICTNAENQHNQKKWDGTSSRFKGVCWSKRDRVWKVGFRCYGKRIDIGGFKDEVIAAKAYDDAATKYFGKFARLNLQKPSEFDREAQK